MQAQTQNKYTSGLIKNNESARRKAKRRLIGSILMLLIALIVLLNVTAKLKPIPINPTVIQIEKDTKINASNILATTSKVNASGAYNAVMDKSSASTTKVVASAEVKAIAIPGTTINADNDESKATIITDKSKKDASENVIDAPTKPKHLPKFTPKIVSIKFTPKPTPDEILNGNIPKSRDDYYIQLVTNHNKTKIIDIQQQFARAQIKTSIESLKDGGYRLRIGPFKSQNTANKRLTQIMQP